MTTPQPSAPLAADAAPTPETRPRIYVACLAAYNNGCLHGRWIDATTPDEVMAEVCAMLAASPLPDAEEWAIHDYEGFEGAHLSEYESFETVCNLAAQQGRNKLREVRKAGVEATLYATREDETGRGWARPHEVMAEEEGK